MIVKVDFYFRCGESNDFLVIGVLWCRKVKWCLHVSQALELRVMGSRRVLDS
jgi:hypothetical protein